MPLNCSHLPEAVVDIIRDIPFDRKSAPDYSYQTKVEIYDSRCSGCPYARIEVHSTVECTKPILFRNSENAVRFARRNGYKILRLCEYPFDVTYRNGKPIYPNLTEIVSNTCELWDEKKFQNEEQPLDGWLITETLKLMETDGVSQE